MDNDYLIKIVYNTINKEDVVGIMLSGSYAENKQNKNSDVDLVVISKLANRQTTTKFQKNKELYHLIVFPINKVFELICDDFIKEEFVFFSVFKKGHILLDQEGILQSIKELLNGIEPSLSERTLMNKVHDISEDLIYLGENENALGVTLNVHILTQQILVGLLAPQCRFLDKIMRSHPSQYQFLNEALHDFLISHDVDKYTNNIKSVLNSICELHCNYSSSDTLLEKSPDNDSMIFVPDERIYEETVKNILCSLNNNIPGIQVYAFYVGNCNIYARGTYIAIIGDKYKRNCLLSNINNLLAKDVFHIMPKIIFPYNTIFFHLNIFGDKQYRDEINGLFIECFNLMLESDCANRGVELGYIMCFSLFRILGQQLDVFMHTIIMLYLPDAININGRASHAMLAGRHNNIMPILDGVYAKSKNEMHLFIEKVFKSEIIDTKEITRMCHSIVHVSANSKKMPYNAALFKVNSHSIIYNIFNHVLSVFSLDSYQKLIICYNCSKFLS
ncbi:MAG: nucleotidyltransferase domain-containing protein [Bacteroidaceae bacterium]|nr:nucleotidyltransferase domain-containing protein [Bacteroidaceae bacterium]